MSNAVRPCKPYVRDTTVKDCAELAVTMREEDKREVWHASRSSPKDVLLKSVSSSRLCWTVMWQGKVVAIFGVCGTKNDTGIPWMLASDDLVKIRKSFLRECKDYVNKMQEHHPLLANIAWTKNTVHIQWLKWLGFEFQEPFPFGEDQELFTYFYRKTQHV